MADIPDLDTAKNAWAWIVYLTGLVVTGIIVGRKAGSAEEKVETLAIEFNDFKHNDFLTKAEHDGIMTQCQEHTWTKFCLALEKRDREFDRKFSQICSGIQRIEQKIDERGKQ